MIKNYFSLSSFPILIISLFLICSCSQETFTLPDLKSESIQDYRYLLLTSGDKGIRNTAKSASSPGIFSPTLQPKTAGNFKLVFDLKTPTFSDTLIIHDIIVYATKEDAIEALGNTEENGGISFLKEQAWKIDFQTLEQIL